MKTLRLTKDDFKKNVDTYYSDYVGKEDLSDFDGHLEIEGKLGWVHFVSIKVSGRIVAEAGSGIKAGWGIEAGLAITCSANISASLRIFAGLCICRMPTEEEKKITCRKLEKGSIEYGVLEEKEELKA